MKKLKFLILEFLAEKANFLRVGARNACGEVFNLLYLIILMHLLQRFFPGYDQENSARFQKDASR